MKGKFIWVAFAAMLALAIVGCKGDDSSGGGGGGGSSGGNSRDSRLVGTWEQLAATPQCKLNGDGTFEMPADDSGVMATIDGAEWSARNGKFTLYMPEAGDPSGSEYSPEMTIEADYAFTKGLYDDDDIVEFSNVSGEVGEFQLPKKLQKITSYDSRLLYKWTESNETNPMTMTFDKSGTVTLEVIDARENVLHKRTIWWTADRKKLTIIVRKDDSSKNLSTTYTIDGTNLEFNPYLEIGGTFIADETLDTGSGKNKFSRE